MVKSGLEKNILEIPSFVHHVIFITEFVLLIKTPHFYLIENGWSMEEFQKYLDHILSKTSTTSTMSF